MAKKLLFDAEEELWNKVLNFKVNKGLKNNNEAVEVLLKTALEPIHNTKELVVIKDMPENIVHEIKKFRNEIPTYEKGNDIPFIIIKDKKSMTFFCQVYVAASDLVKLGDKDSVIDPELQEEHRANRELEPDNYYFIRMADDAVDGRAFTEIVIEYNNNYTPNKPLKILGGQHRFEAIKNALIKEENNYHGIKVYFDLDKDQRAEIMRISNTNINVSSDLRDRIEEHRLSPANMLRNLCQENGILYKDKDFGDKRRHEDEFNPTVRMMRTFLVNFFVGLEYDGDADKDALEPYICTTGKDVDKEYIKIFNKFKKSGNFDDNRLIETVKRFAKLHEAQFKNADKIKGSAKKEYKIKSFSYSIISSWSFAAGYLQKDEKRLKKLFSLSELSGDSDPLNATSMSKAKHKTDPETYRGLGTRMEKKERGRLLQLFLEYSKSEKHKITIDMCNAAIEIYHANRASIEAEEKKKNAF